MKKASFILITSLLLSILTVGVYATDPAEVLQNHEGAVGRITELLEQGNKEEAVQELDSLNLAVINARANLHGFSFEGESGKELTDPFILPKGNYRVHFTTRGHGIVKVVYLSEDDEKLLFLSPQQAQKGASTLYRSTGEKIAIQFSNVSNPPFKLVFEKLE